MKFRRFLKNIWRRKFPHDFHAAFDLTRFVLFGILITSPPIVSSVECGPDRLVLITSSPLSRSPSYQARLQQTKASRSRHIDHGSAHFTIPSNFFANVASSGFVPEDLPRVHSSARAVEAWRTIDRGPSAAIARSGSG